MCEQNESYEDLVKQLKPFSLIVRKISAEEFTKLKVVDDPKRIKDEVIPQEVSRIDTEDEKPEQEIEVVLAEVESNPDYKLSNDDSVRYSCFMCKKEGMGYSEGFAHFQLHIDYFPIQCSLCDEANTDVLSFAKHCRSLHPDLEKVKYIYKYNTNCFKWIHNILTIEPNPQFKTSPQKYCPACNWIHLSAPDVNNPDESKQTLKPNQILRHIHEHIHYMPFSCIKCRDNGIEYRIYVLDSMPRKHFHSEHKELVNDPPFWRFFTKKYSIPSLDKFIANYLSIFGLKVAKKRCKRNKLLIDSQIAKQEKERQTTQTKSLIQTDSHSKAIALKPIVTQIGINGQISLKDVLFLKTLDQTNPNLLIQLNSLNALNSKPISINEMENPLLFYPSNDKIMSRPTPVESTDLGIVCIDPVSHSLIDSLL